VAAFSCASLLALLALITLAVKTFVEWKVQQNIHSSQQHAKE
jgi:sulfate transport system permease protein